MDKGEVVHPTAFVRCRHCKSNTVDPTATKTCGHVFCKNASSCASCRPRRALDAKHQQGTTVCCAFTSMC
ncbi:hypothetical protein K438DRAFT_1856383, partial [Mycena galopus ATCC 62051]